MMTCEEFCKIFQLTEKNALTLKEAWDKVTEGWDEKKLPFFLDHGFFEKLFPYCEMPFPEEKIMPMADAVISMAQKHPEVSLLAYICHRGAFVLENPVCLKWQDPIPLLGKELSGMFSMMISLGAYPLFRKSHEEMGIPEKYSLDALKWFGGTMLAYKEAHDGIPGRPMDFGWIRLHIRKELFRIGRMEYLVHPYIDWMPAVYRRGKDELAVLCRDGWTFRPDGRRANPGDEVIFTSKMTETQDTVTGSPCRPDGTVDFERTVTLNRREWRLLASPWDICPSIHIPSGCRMPYESVKESMLEAREFFQKYLHRHVPFFCCCSWILNPAWETMLKNSNMARFRTEGYAVPSQPWGPMAGVGFIFGRSDVPPEELPAHNTIQKVMQEAHRKNLLGSGCLFILAEDIEKTGDQYYRKKYMF